MQSYSQHSEDSVVAGLFPEGFKGMVLEIGAFDPKSLSNSRLFIEAGWSAALVEFSPAPLRNLLKEYGGNPAVMIFQGAIASEKKSTDPLTFKQFRVTDDALSTDSKEHHELWKGVGGYFGSMYVPAIPVDFFANLGADFVSIDTEGSSVDVFAGYLESAMTLPKVICVEHNNRHAEVAALATKFGYASVPHPPSCGENTILQRVR